MVIKPDDELNQKIISTMLSGKGIGPRLSELARALSRPRSTIDLRVRLLENDEIIAGYKPIINWEKLGFKIQGHVGIACSEDSIPPLVALLTEDGSTAEVWEPTTGSFSVIAKCRFKDYEEIKKLREKIQKIKNIQNIDVWLTGPYHKLG